MRCSRSGPSGRGEGRRSGAEPIDFDGFDRGEAGPNRGEALPRAHRCEAHVPHEIETEPAVTPETSRARLDLVIADLMVMAVGG